MSLLQAVSVGVLDPLIALLLADADPDSVITLMQACRSMGPWAAMAQARVREAMARSSRTLIAMMRRTRRPDLIRLAPHPWDGDVVIESLRHPRFLTTNPLEHIPSARLVGDHGLVARIYNLLGESLCNTHMPTAVLAPRFHAMSAIQAAPDPLQLLASYPAVMRDDITIVSRALAATRYPPNVRLTRLKAFYASLSDECRSAVRVAVAIVHQEPLLLRELTREHRADPGVVGMAVAQQGMALAYASAALQDDRGLVLVAASNVWQAMHAASPRLHADRELWRAVALKHATASDAGRLYAAIPGVDRDYFRDLVAACPQYLCHCALQEATRGCDSDEATVLAAVQRSGAALRHASDALRDNAAVVRTAIRHDGSHLQHASERLRSDEEMLALAMRTCGEAIQHASPRVRDDPARILLAVRSYPRAFAFASGRLRADRAFVLDAVDANGLCLNFVPKDFCSDWEVARRAVANCAFALTYVAPELVARRPFVLELARHSNGVLGHLLRANRAAYIHDKELALCAADHDGLAALRALAEHGSALLADRDVARAAVRQAPEAAAALAALHLRADTLAWAAAAESPQ